MQKSQLRAPRTNALSIRPQGHGHFWQPSAQRAARGFFGPNAVTNTYEDANTSPLWPTRELDGGSSQLPLDLKGWGGGCNDHFSFRWRFARGLYNDFRNVFCKAFRAFLQGVLQGFFTTCLQDVLQGF